MEFKIEKAPWQSNIYDLEIGPLNVRFDEIRRGYFGDCIALYFDGNRKSQVMSDTELSNKLIQWSEDHDINVKRESR